MPNPKIIGVDAGEPGGDWTAEAEVTRLPDGTLRIDNLRWYRQTIDLKANHDDNEPLTAHDVGADPTIGELG